MLYRVLLALISSLAIADPAFAADPIRFRVLTEDVYATQCRDEFCTTVQVTRSRSSDGVSQTVLLVSAYDPESTPIIQVSLPIDDSAFVVDPEGKWATVTHPNATVTWTITDDYREETLLVTKIVDRRPAAPEQEQHPGVLRMRERERLDGAIATGTAGPETAPIEINTAVSPPTIGIGDAVISIRKTIRIERSLDITDEQPPDETLRPSM